MQGSQGDVQKAPRLAKDVRLSPTLIPVANTILQRRYVDRKSLVAVQESLASDQVVISLKRLQEFIRRLLYVLPAHQALRLGVNRELLTIIRRRHQLPVEPRLGRLVTVKPCRRFDIRHRHRRRITLEPKLKRPAPPVARPRKVGPAFKDQPMLTGILLEPTREEVSAFQRLHRTQIAEINREAVRKIRVVNRDMITNDRGRSYNLRTHDDYSPEDLQKEFGLTYAEAQSCFLTID